MVQEAVYRRIASDIRRDVQSRGWCFVECSAMGGEIIAIVRGEPPLLEFEQERLAKAIEAIRKSNPKQMFVARYTIPEFMALCQSPSFQLVHEVVKIGGEINVSPEASEDVL